jgi:hypothetical protein
LEGLFLETRRGLMAGKLKTQLDTLKGQRARIQARIAEIESREKRRVRKDDTRLKVIVGAACLADAGIHADTKTRLREILYRGVKAGRDREFLQLKGWV